MSTFKSFLKLGPQDFTVVACRSMHTLVCKEMYESWLTPRVASSWWVIRIARCLSLYPAFSQNFQAIMQ